MKVSPSPLAGLLSRPLTDPPGESFADQRTELLNLRSQSTQEHTVVLDPNRTVAEQVSRLDVPPGARPRAHRGRSRASRRRMKNASRIAYGSLKPKSMIPLWGWICLILGVTLLGLAIGVLVEGTYQLIYYRSICR